MNFQDRTGLTPPPAPTGPTDRLSRMMRHTTLIAIGVVLLGAGIVAAVLYIQSRPTHLKIAVGPRSGEDIRLVQALQQHLAREKAKIRLQVLRKDTGSESAEALDKGEVDLAVVRRDSGMPKMGQVIAALVRRRPSPSMSMRAAVPSGSSTGASSRCSVAGIIGCSFQEGHGTGFAGP